MRAALRILQAGPGITLQDAGRQGWLRYGVNTAGPMDSAACQLANRAVGAPAGAACLEVPPVGLELTAEGRALRLALAGGAFDIRLDGRALPEAVALTLEPGSRLSVKPGAAGRWCYIACAEPFDLTGEMGSLATHLRSGIGGLEGRALVAGDRLPLCAPASAPASLASDAGEWRLLSPLLTPADPDSPLRVIAGPQAGAFTAEALATFTSCEWTLSNRADRMGAWLEGPALAHKSGFNITSDGITMGAIQVPGNGQPLVLMADRQPTGGYPKIATVISADLGRFAQLRPGARCRFQLVSHSEAVTARRTMAEALARGPQRAALIRRDLSSDFLLSLNLISGVVGPEF